MADKFLPGPDSAGAVVLQGSRKLRWASRAVALVAAVTVLATAAARSQNATWLTNPGSNDFDTGANWTPATVPTGTAFFGTSAVTGLTFSAATTTIDGWTFNPGASNYTFTNGQDLVFNGAGIVINGGSATLVNANTVNFNNSSTAGAAAIINNFDIEFNNNSSAGTANITNNSGLDFNNNSTAGNATINNNTFGAAVAFGTGSTAGSATINNNINGATIAFNPGSTAGNATINNNFGTLFFASSSAGNAIINNSSLFMDFSGSGTAANATITNNINDDITFENGSTASNATIANNGNLFFNDISSAGSATITNSSGGTLTFSTGATADNATITSSGVFLFEDNTTAGSATITVNGGRLTISGPATAGNATITTNSGGLTLLDLDASGGTARFILNGTGALDISFLTTGGTTAGSIEGDGRVFLGANNLAVGGSGLSTVFSGVIQDGSALGGGGTGGSLTKVGTGTLALSEANTYTGGTTISAGTLQLGNGGTTGSIVGDVTDNATLNFDRSDTFTFGGVISGTGAVNQIGTGTVILTATDTYGGGTTISAGTLQIGNGGTTGSIAGNVIDNATLNFDRSDPVTFAGTISGSGGVNQIGTDTLTLTGAGIYTGATNVDAGTLQAGAAGVFAPASAFTVASGATLALDNFNQTIGSLAGNGNVTLGSATLTTGNDNTNSTFSGALSGSGGLIKIGTGTFVLAGANAYTGATTVSGGTLEVDGAIAASSGVTVAAGATLSGTGAVDPAATTTIMSQGTLAPGNAANPTGTLTITGNLAFQSAALYLITVSGADAGSTNVGGTAALDGTVEVTFVSTPSAKKSYDILHAAGGLGGSVFTGVSGDSNFDVSLSYTATDVFLNLVAELSAGTHLNENQQNVANALNNFFNGGGSLPPGFANLFNLTGAPLANALTQLDGENANGAERVAFDLMNEFLGLMLDPYVYGRGGFAPGAQQLGFAPDQLNQLPPDIALAYAGLLKATPPQTFAQRWTTWASGFGGSATANGDPIVGSNNVTTTTYGYAAGMDYHYSPDTVFGFSLAGGGTNWNLANALGAGRSDAFLAGIYGVTHEGPWYLGGALAFANNWFTTNRTAFAGDQLTARFQGQSYAARLEGGYRFAVPMDRNAIGVIPYAAIQAQNFRTPSYSETDLTGGGFGLSYNAMNGTDTRSELGSRFDALTALNNLPLVLRAKVAWAHDWVSNPSLNAGFESLPGSSFTVFGAPIPHDSALASAGAQLFFTPNWSLLAKFDGEFANGSQLYAGSGTLRYTW
jgi:autotransporter-associated beta strand protein